MMTSSVDRVHNQHDRQTDQRTMASRLTNKKQTVVLFAGRTQSLVKQMANRITHGRIGRRFGKWVGKRGTIGLGRTVSRKRVGKRGTIGFGQTVGTDGLDRRLGQTVWADGGHKSVRRGEKQRTVRQAEFERRPRVLSLFPLAGEY